MKHYVADFETTTTPDKTRVWVWGVSEVGNAEYFNYDTTIESFMEWCEAGDNKLVYFHNLKFDAEFIIYHLLVNMKYEYSDTKRTHTFNAVISRQGQFYEVEVIFSREKRKTHKVIFRDSHKKLPFAAEKIAKDFKLPISKLEIDYHKDRPVGYIPTDDEIEYLKHDVQIVATALQIQYEQGLDRMTIGSDALHNFKQVMGRHEFERTFPVLSHDADADIRLAYYGGFTYVNSDTAIEVSGGVVFDVNSLYPAVMYDRPLPYGVPIPFRGRYDPDDRYPLYIQVVTCTFDIKEGKIPTIQDKHTGRFQRTEYLKSSGDDPLTLVLTSVDLELFMEHYDVTVHEWEGGYKFRQCVGVFREYIDEWMRIKENSAGAVRQLAKLMLNSLYGKFATNPDVTGKYPIIEDNHVRYIMKEEEEFRDPVYTAMGCFITAWARDLTIRSAQSVFHRFLYADTDSIHLSGTEMPDIDVHPSKLGAWKHEGTFTRARFIRAKTYIEEIDGALHVTCAGMPDNVKEKVTWENFHAGLVLDGKLMPKHVEGGIVLVDTSFTIKGK